ncbi:MAG: hypothetical protein Q4B54_02005 [Coriobacteriales bacterium]|nr:hypothetical protein [Coriobacteriales bacterium]
MELVKPDPLYIDGRPRYTLSSYEAPAVVIHILHVCEEDVEMALEETLEQYGGDMSKLDDSEWLRQRFGGIDNAEELREMIREELRSPDGPIARNQKVTQSLDVLIQRLVERIPDDVFESTRLGVKEKLNELYGTDDMPESFLISRAGMNKAEFNEMVDAQAEESAKYDAVMNAWADHFHLEVKDEEIPQLLGVNEVQTRDFVESMHRTGQWELAHEAARLNKALEAIIASCNCTYEYETPEHAEKRVAEIRKLREAESNARKEHPHLKLV